MKKLIIICFCFTISFNTYSFDKNEFNSSIENIFTGSFNYASKKAALAMKETENKLKAHNAKNYSTKFSTEISSSYSTGGTMVYLGEGDILNQLTEKSSMRTSLISNLSQSKTLFYLGGNYNKSIKSVISYDNKITKINSRITQLRNSSWLINRIINLHTTNTLIAKEYTTLKLLRKFRKEIKERISLKISSIKDLQVIDNEITSVQFWISKLELNKHSFNTELSKYAPIEVFKYYKKYTSHKFEKQIIKPTLKTCNNIFSNAEVHERNKINSDKEASLISLSGSVNSRINVYSQTNSNNSATNYGASVNISFNYPLLNNLEKNSIKALAYYNNLIVKYKYKEIKRSQRNISENETTGYNDAIKSYKKLKSLQKKREKEIEKFNQLEDASFITTYQWTQLFNRKRTQDNHLAGLRASLIITQLSNIYTCYLQTLNN